jgi:hypothetical protein
MGTVTFLVARCQSSPVESSPPIPRHNRSEAAITPGVDTSRALPMTYCVCTRPMFIKDPDLSYRARCFLCGHLPSQE